MNITFIRSFEIGRLHNYNKNPEAMNSPLICHILIGAPGSGKSTLAEQWVTRSPEFLWVSTDRIRAEVLGDVQAVGHWEEVEAVVIHQIQTAVAKQQPIIYDATNAKRAWRLSLLQKLATCPVQWIGWRLTSSLATCKAQNQGRDRQVPDAVIESFYNAIEQFPPDPAEGFVDVHDVPWQNGKFDFEMMERLIQQLPRSLQQRQNKAAQVALHPYSGLLAFEQLMYLIATLMHYPGLGNLHQTHPSWLARELGVEILPKFETAAAEISALITKQQGKVYADIHAIDHNLKWLQNNGLVNAAYTHQNFDLPGTEVFSRLHLHRYSDRSIFQRLMQTIRFLAHHPQLKSAAQKTALIALHEAMKRQGVIPNLQGKEQDKKDQANLRKDFQVALKPYGIMSSQPMRDGYFVGTGILSTAELLRVYHSLEGQATHLADPIAFQAYETFRDRMAHLELNTLTLYPVRKVVDQPIVNPQYLSPLSLTHCTEEVEQAIQTSQSLWIRRLHGTGRFHQDDDTAYEVLPIQIVFYNIAWYLGYERLQDYLLEFYRLDRLMLEPIGTGFTPRCYPRDYQLAKLEQLNRLQRGGYGVFLGSNPQEQQCFLSSDPKARNRVMETLELWFTDEMFRFVSEGTQRFPGIRMSSRNPLGVAMTTAEKQEVFTLKRTPDPDFPHRLKAQLPCWTLQHSIDLQSWILGFAGQVRVISPKYLAVQISQKAQEIEQVYRNN
jgi:predicted kinase